MDIDQSRDMFYFSAIEGTVPELGRGNVLLSHSFLIGFYQMVCQIQRGDISVNYAAAARNYLHQEQEL